MSKVWHGVSLMDGTYDNGSHHHEIEDGKLAAEATHRKAAVTARGSFCLEEANSADSWVQVRGLAPYLKTAVGNQRNT